MQKRFAAKSAHIAGTEPTSADIDESLCKIGRAKIGRAKIARANIGRAKIGRAKSAADAKSRHPDPEAGAVRHACRASSIFEVNDEMSAKYQQYQRNRPPTNAAARSTMSSPADGDT